MLYWKELVHSTRCIPEGRETAASQTWKNEEKSIMALCLELSADNSVYMV